MANRVPLVVANQKMREIADGDTLDLTGNPLIVGGDLTPSTDSAYDLGSSSKKWKDLHLSGSTIHLGSLLLQDSGGTLVTRDSAAGPAVAIGLSSNTTDDLTEGSTNLYFTNSRAQTQAQAVSINNVSEDTTPQLGGNLDLNSNNITGTGDITITGVITSTDSAVFGGNGSTSGTKIDDGKIILRTGTGSVAYIDLYCETNNAHRVRVQSPAHSQYSGNVTVKLPAENGTLGTVGTSSDTLLIKDSAGSTLKTVIGVGNTAL